MDHPCGGNATHRAELGGPAECGPLGARDDCPTCPITVKLALTRIDGVIDVKSNLPKRETTVVFDSAKVKVEALTSATKNAGFPSTVVSVNP